MAKKKDQFTHTTRRWADFRGIFNCGVVRPIMAYRPLREKSPFMGQGL